MGVLEVFVPCRLLRLRVRMGLASDVSILERFLLRSIATGAGSTVTDIAGTLEISPRMVIDCLGDLWRAGHVHLDFLDDREAVRLSEETAQRLREGNVDSLASAYETTDVREMAFDTLIGRVVPIRATTRRVPHNLRVPRMPADPAPTDLDPAALAGAIERDLHQDGPAGEVATTESALRVMDAYLDPDQARETTTSGFVPMVVSVVRDAELGLRVTVTDTGLSRPERDRATRRLQRLVDEDPRAAFVRVLAGEATEAVALQAPPLPVAVAAVQRQAAALAAVVTGKRQHEHDRLRMAFDDVMNRVGQAWAAQAEVTVVDGAEAHERVIRQLIDGASTQVVLCVTWLRYAGLSRYLEQLERAVDRGVQIVVLWGIGASDTLEQPVVNAIHNLQRRGAGRGTDRVLVKTRVPTQVHAKAIVSDDRRALVTSHNFLSGGEHGELGLLVSAVEGRRCEVVESLLGWTYTSFPDMDLAQAVIRGASAFGPREDWTAPETAAVMPAFHPSLDAGSPADAQVTAWVQAWTAAARELASLIAVLPATATTVTDVEHQVVLRRAFATAERHVLVTSHRLAGQVVDATFLAAVAACLERGVDVTLVYGELTPDARLARAALGRLAAPTDEGRGQFLLLHDHSNHAKVLVRDDEVVIGSFNYLSFSGHYSGRGRHRDRGELSIRVTDAALADVVLRTFGAFPRRAEAVPVDVGTAAPGPASADLSLARAVLVLLDEALGHPVGDDLAGLARAGSHELAVLEALEHIGAPATARERLCAAVLAADPEAGRLWWGRLLQLVWRRHDFLAALAVRSRVGDAVTHPRWPVVRTAAAWAAGDCSDLLLDVALEDGLDRAEREALAMVAVCELLDRGQMIVGNVLETWAPQLDGDVAELAAAALALSEATSAPLPVAGLRAAAAVSRAREDEDEAWARLLAVLQRLRNFPPGFASGDLTKRWVFGESGPLAHLETLADRRDTAGVRQWRAAQVTLDPHEWLAWSAERASAREIVGNRRTSLVAKVAAILDAAEAVELITRAGAGFTADPAVTSFLVAAGPLVRRLAGRQRESVDGYLTEAAVQWLAATLEDIA